MEGLLDGVADTGEKRRAYLLTIRDKAEDISRMVSQIFLYSKMELEDYPVHLQTIRLDALLQTFLRGAQAEYTARGLTVTAEPLPAVSAAAIRSSCGGFSPTFWTTAPSIKQRRRAPCAFGWRTWARTAA